MKKNNKTIIKNKNFKLKKNQILCREIGDNTFDLKNHNSAETQCIALNFCPINAEF